MYISICLRINLTLTRDVDTELRPLLASARLKPGVARLVTHLRENRVPAAIATSSRKTNSRVKMSGHTELFSMFSHKVCDDKMIIMDRVIHRQVRLSAKHDQKISID